jgi:hypothetical protein
MLEVGGEIIRYNAKMYYYYNKSGIRTRSWLKSQEEKDNIDSNLSDPYQSYKNAFDGSLRIKERGVYWTEPQEHKVGIPNFSVKTFWYNNNNAFGNRDWGINGGITHDTAEGVITLNASEGFVGNRIMAATVGSEGYNGAYAHYGTRMRIPKRSGPTGGGGLFFFGADGGAGYFIELCKTEIFDVPGGPVRSEFDNEVGFRLTTLKSLVGGLVAVASSEFGSVDTIQLTSNTSMLTTRCSIQTMMIFQPMTVFVVATPLTRGIVSLYSVKT